MHHRFIRDLFIIFRLSEFPIVIGDIIILLRYFFKEDFKQFSALDISNALYPRSKQSSQYSNGRNKEIKHSFKW